MGHGRGGSSTLVGAWNLLIVSPAEELPGLEGLLGSTNTGKTDGAPRLTLATSVAEAAVRLSAAGCDAAVCAFQPDVDAISLLVHARPLGIPVVILSDRADRAAAVAAFRAGAADHLERRELTSDRLVRSLARAVEDRAARTALVESEERYRDLVEHSEALLCTHTLSGRLLSVNRSAARKLGYEPEELLGHSMDQMLWPPARADFDKYLDEITRQGRAQGVLSVMTRSGERRLWEYNNTLRREEGGTAVVRGLAFDVTKDRGLKKAMRASEERLRHLFERNLAGICRNSWSGRLLDCNVAYAQLFGWSSPEEMRGIDVSRLWPSGADREAFLAELEARGSVTNRELKLVRRDGTPVWVLANESVLPGEPGAESVIEGVVLDISERREREEQQREGLRLEAVGQLAGGVAHDFNNLLTTILGYGELLLERAEEPGLRQGLSEILRAGERAAVVTRQLLAFGRRQLAAPRPLDLTAVVQATHDTLQRILGSAIGLELRLDDGLGAVKADRAMMESLVSNLAAAARSSMPSGGTVTIETSLVEQVVPLVRDGQRLPEGPYVRLSVRDTAPPLSPEARARVFEPFFRRGERLMGGLELAAAYGIVRQTGGVIWMEAEADGNRVEVRLPISSDVPEVARAAAPPVPARPLRILLVDDEASVRRMSRAVLEEAGYEVREAASGAEAMSALDAEGPFDLLLTDVVMPGLDGATLAERLVARAPGLSVVLMTGHASALEGRSERVLKKPFTPEVLRARVADALGRPAAERDRAMSGSSGATPSGFPPAPSGLSRTPSGVHWYPSSTEALLRES